MRKKRPMSRAIEGEKPEKSPMDGSEIDFLMS
jgi:hypothetical protein